MRSNAAAVSEVMDTLAELWAPVKLESVCDWVESNCELPTGAITGKVNLRKTPYAREILERYGDKKTRHLVLVFATQLAKTTILILGMLYRIARDPEDALWIMANADQARDFNKERFMAFVRLCKAVLNQVPRTAKGVIDKHKWGFVAQHYASMVLNFVGAGSPANLASRPRGLIQMDEVDKFYDQLGFDAGTIALAEERQKTMNFPLSVKASSPTLADRMIWQEYLKTDQRQYWVPCPRCEQKILLLFSVKSEKHGDCGVRWWHENEEEAKTEKAWDMRKVKANAFYKCQCCAGTIHDFEREDMIQTENGALWVPQTDRQESGRHGYHLSSIYSVLGNETSLGSIAVKFLLAKGHRSEHQNFINGWLAEPWDEIMRHDFKEIRLVSFAENKPSDDSVAIMAIDVQASGHWVVIRRFARPTPEMPHGQSWLLFADFVQTEDELVELQAEYEVPGDNVTMDMAHRPSHVGKTILAHGWRGIWGSPNTKKFYHPGPGGTRTERPYSVVQFRDAMLGTAWENRTFKRIPYVLFAKNEMIDAVCSLRYAEPPIWHCTVNVSPRYARHLNSRVKRKQINKKTGHPEWIYFELHQENHLYDCEVHVTVRAMTLGLISLPPETQNQNADS